MKIPRIHRPPAGPRTRTVVDAAKCYGHIAYFAIVMLEAHGIYSVTAGFLLVASAAAAVIGETA